MKAKIKRVVNPADRVMQAARKRACPVAALMSAVTRSVSAGLKCGRASAQGRAALRLHRQSERLLRRHLQAIITIRRGGEELLKVEREIVALAEGQGLIAKLATPVHSS